MRCRDTNLESRSVFNVFFSAFLTCFKNIRHHQKQRSNPSRFASFPQFCTHFHYYFPIFKKSLRLWSCLPCRCTTLGGCFSRLYDTLRVEARGQQNIRDKHEFLFTSPSAHCKEPFATFTMNPRNCLELARASICCKSMAHDECVYASLF